MGFIKFQDNRCDGSYFNVNCGSAWHARDFVGHLLAGIFLLLAGTLRLGSLTSFIPSPVITGFTSGIAIIIALGQLDNFFGVRSEGHNLIEKISSYRSLGFDLSIPTTVMSILVVLGLVFFPKNGMR